MLTNKTYYYIVLITSFYTLIKKYHYDTFLLTFNEIGLNMILKAHYNLVRIQQLVADENTRYMTRSSLKDAHNAGFSETEIVDTVISLKNQNLYKSMPSDYDDKLWQDVYKTTKKSTKLYIKLQENPQGTGVVISFKIDEEGVYDV